MILVVLAISTVLASSCPQRIAPVRPSAIAHDLAVTNGGPSERIGPAQFAALELE